MMQIDLCKPEMLDFVTKNLKKIKLVKPNTPTVGSGCNDLHWDIRTWQQFRRKWKNQMNQVYAGSYIGRASHGETVI